MANTIGLATCLQFLLSTSLAASPPSSPIDRIAIPVAGKVSATGAAANHRVVATHDVVRVGKDSSCFPSLLDEGLRHVSIVRSLSIMADNKEVFVQRSVYADWVDARAIAVVRSPNAGWWLSITGGDGAEGYEIRVFFDMTQVTRRTMYSLLVNKPTQETRYWTRTLDDR